MCLRHGVILLSLVVAAGCTAGPNYKRPTVTPPTNYRGTLSPDQAQSIADLPWVEQFKEPALAELIRVAIDENLDLRTAIARVMEFRARADAARADLRPTLSGTLGVSPRTKISLEDDVVRSLYSVGAVFNWEIDFFGRLRRASEAARNDLLATEDGARAVMSLLVSDVATAWFEVRSFDEQLAITRRNVQFQQEALDLTRRRVQGGVASGLDEQQAISQLASTRAQVPFYEQLIQQRENLISVLLGRSPAAVTRPEGPVEWPQPPDIPVGLPSQLLERRPDIRFAEKQLMAATSRIGVAIASSFPFPRIGLTAFFGSLSDALDQVFDGDSGVISWGPFVDWPIVEAGRGTARIAIARAQTEQAALTYRNAILLSLREVADALVAIQKIRERIVEQEIQVDAARRALDLSNARYSGGVTDYLEVLDAQRVLYAAEINLADSRQSQLVASVDLYRALGGGWSDDELKKLMEKPATATQ